MKNKQMYFAASVLMFATLLMSGCGHKDPADVVRQRANERWKLLFDHHAAQAYEYLSPGFRSIHTIEEYIGFIASSHLQWQSAIVSTPACDADVCTVRVDVTSLVPARFTGLPRDFTHEAPVVEHWVLSEGQWYFLPDSNIKIDPAQVAAQADKAAKPGDAPVPSLAPGAAPPKPMVLPAAPSQPSNVPPQPAPAKPADAPPAHPSAGGN